jgi:hypothetical protein
MNTLAAPACVARDGSSRKRRTRNGVLLLYLAIAAIYLLTASGRIGNVDGDTMWRVSWSLLREGSLSSEPCTPGDLHCVPGVDGRYYGAFGVLPSVLMVPLNAAGRRLALWAGRDQYLYARTLVSLCGALVGAAVCVMLALWIDSLGVPWRVAVGPALLLAFASPFWAYSAKGFWSEPYFTLATVAAAYLLTIAESKMSLLLAGLAIGVACACRIQGVFIIPGLLLYRYLLRRRQSIVKHALDSTLISGGWAVVFAWVLWLNYTRFGSFLRTGYHSQGMTFSDHWSQPFFYGMWKLLFDGEQGLITFTPWILLIVILARRIYRILPAQFVLVFATLIPNLCFLGGYSFSLSGGNVGPRYFVAILPFFALLLTPMFTWRFWASLSALARGAVLAAVLLSLGIQLAGVPYPNGRYLLLKSYYQSISEEPWWLGLPTLAAVWSLPELVAEVPHWKGAAVVGNTPARIGLGSEPKRNPRESTSPRAYLLSTSNPMAVLTPDLWLLRAVLVGIPAYLALIVVGVLSATSVLAFRLLFENSPALDASYTTQDGP